MRTRTARVFGASGGVVIFAGCAQILGIGDYRVGTPPKLDAGSHEAGALKLSDFESRRCGECVLANCAEAVTACRGVEPCASWERCMAHCAPGDGSCENTCFVSAAKTDGPMGSVAMCTVQYCYEPCQASGLSSAYGPGCAAAILKDNCGTDLQACAADSNCRAAMECLAAQDCILPMSSADSGSSQGQNPACTWFCADRALLYTPIVVDAGFNYNPALALPVCWALGQDTYRDCRLDNLSCARRYPKSYGTSNLNVHVTVRVHEGPSPEYPGNPLPSMQVRACIDDGSSKCDASSLNALVSQTGTDGTASFDLSQSGTAGLAWYFEVTPPTPWPTGPSAILFHSGRPMTEDTYLSLPIGTANGWQRSLKDQSDPLTGGHWDSRRGGLWVEPRSCSLQYAQGLTIVVDGQDSGLTPSKYATLLAGLFSTPTSETVAAFVGGIDPGTHAVYAYDENNRKVSEQNVLIQQGELTVLYWFAPETE